MLPSTDREGRRLTTMVPRLLDFSRCKAEDLVLYNIYMMQKIFEDR